jgi:hypothetical protein
MKPWQLAQQRAHLYEQLCVLTDALLELTYAWWQADPEIHDLPVRTSEQLKLPLVEHASPSGPRQPSPNPSDYQHPPDHGRTTADDDFPF